MAPRGVRAPRCLGLLAALVIGAGVLTLAPGTAQAAPARPATAAAPRGCAPNALAARIAQVGRDLDNRVQQLNALQAEVDAAGPLTLLDRSTLLADLANELSGIQALAAKAPGDTTCAAVRADGRAMVVNYRVYLVMTPQVHLTKSADSEASVAGRLAARLPQLQAAITRAAGAGRDMTAAAAALGDLGRQVAVARADSAGISAAVLAFTPASYPGCWATFLGDRARLQAGSVALRRASHDLSLILGQLRG
jgi:hypothetical protein